MVTVEDATSVVVEARKCKPLVYLTKLIVTLTILLCTHNPSLSRLDFQEYKKHSLYSSLENGSLLVCGSDPRICRKIHNFHR